MGGGALYGKVPRLYIPLRFCLICQHLLIFIPCQSGIKVSQTYIWVIFGHSPRLSPCFLAKTGSFSSLVSQQSQSINLSFSQYWAKDQGNSLVFLPNLAHCQHFSICNQTQSLSIWIIFGQHTKAIPLRFGKKCLVFMTFRSEISINYIQYGPFLGKITAL